MKPKKRGRATTGRSKALAAKAPSPIARRAKEAHDDNEAKLETCLSTLRDHVREITARFYDAGLVLAQIADEKLYAVRGHASFKALLRAEKVMSPAQAAKLVRIVRRTKREHALLLGLERTHALLTHTDATPEDDSVASLIEDGALIGGKPVTEASKRDIVEATRAVRAAAEPTKEQAARAKADRGVARKVVAALKAAGLPKGEVVVAAQSVTVRWARSAFDAE